MTTTKKLRWTCGALGLWLGAAGMAAADAMPMDEQAYEAAQERIEAQARVERKACRRLKGNAQDICEARAEGKERVALARLRADYEPSPQAVQDAKEAQAEADYEVAREKCDEAKGKAKDACIDQAKAVREAMVRLAIVEKVERVNALKRAKAKEQKQAAARD